MIRFLGRIFFLIQSNSLPTKASIIKIEWLSSCRSAMSPSKFYFDGISNKGLMYVYIWQDLHDEIEAALSVKHN